MGGEKLIMKKGEMEENNLNSLKCKPLSYLIMKNRFRNRKCVDSDQEVIEAHAYLFINSSVSFTLISPISLKLLYDEVYTYNRDLETETTRVYYIGFDFIPLKKFEKLVKVYKNWVRELYDLSDDGAKRAANPLKYLNIRPGMDKEKIRIQLLGVGGDFYKEYQYFLCFPAIADEKKIKKMCKSEWRPGLPFYSKEKRVDFRRWFLSKKILKMFSEKSQLEKLKPNEDIIDLERNIVSLCYGKKSTYTIDIAIREPLKWSTLDFKEAIKKMTNIKSEVDQKVFDAKFRYKDSQLKFLPLTRFLQEIQCKEKKTDDFCDLREIDFHMGFKHNDKDHIYVLFPICKVTSFDYTSKSKIEALKMKTKEGAPLFSAKVERKLGKRSGKSKILIRASRHLNLKPYTIEDFNRWGKIPSIMGCFERQINLNSFFALSGTNISNKTKKVLWHAFQSLAISSSENYDTLETVGDSLLKFLTVYYLVAVSTSKRSEGNLSFLKSRSVSNIRLEHLAQKAKLQYFLQTKMVFKDDWKFPLFQKNLFKRKKSKKSSFIHSKNIADVYESILGGLLVDNFNLVEGVKFMLFTKYWDLGNTSNIEEKYQNLMTVINYHRDMNVYDIFERRSDLASWFYDNSHPGYPMLDKNISFLELWRLNPRASLIQDTQQKFQKKTSLMNTRLDSYLNQENKGNLTLDLNKWIENEYLQTLESVLGYEFKNKSLLRCALTVERSNQPKDLDWGNNLERLEFLGDAVFEVIAISSLYKCSIQHKRHITPKLMTGSKIFLLSNLVMMRFAALLNLHNFVIWNNKKKAKLLRKFGEDVRIKGVHHSCLKFKKFNMRRDKTLSDLWESLAGALIVDGGWRAIEIVFKDILNPFITFYSKHMTIMKMNYKSDALEIMKVEESLDIVETVDQDLKIKLAVVYGKDRKTLEEFEGYDSEELHEEAYIFITENFKIPGKKIKGGSDGDAVVV